MTQQPAQIRQRQRLREKGICERCGKEPAIKGITRCQKCKSKQKDRKTTAIDQGLCSRCLVNPLHTEKTCLECLDKAAIIRENARVKVFEAYGGRKCACCEETEPSFLSIDHINNDGHIERKQGITGYRLYRMLVKLGFPKDRYQILCFNCNSAKKILGICPHQTN